MAGIKRVTLSTQVYEKLKSMILLNEIPQGSRLNEREISKLLNVSPTPIREAINKLKGDGLVETDSWKGSYVREFSERDIADIMELRLFLEQMCLERAEGKLTEEDLKCLQDKNREYEQLFASGQPADLSSAIRINSEFHLFFVRRFGNRWIRDILEQLNECLHLARAPITQRTDGRQTVREHAAIIDALARGDYEEAKERLRAHLIRVKTDLKQIRGE
jgi:DNA-binding GntR family transcriptional regulator